MCTTRIIKPQTPQNQKPIIHTMNKCFSGWTAVLFTLLFATACSRDQDTKPNLPDIDTVVVTPVDTVWLSNNDKGIIKDTLTDGTEVILNAKSNFRYAGREVISMEGSCYIKLHKDTQNFLIRYDSLQIRGKDAEFAINTYFYDRGTDPFGENRFGLRLTIIKGELEVTNLAGTAQYKAGDEIEITRKRMQDTHDWDLEEETGWLDGHYNIKTITISQLSRLVAFQWNVNTGASYIEARGTVHNIYLDLTKPVSYLPDEPSFQNQVKVQQVQDANGSSWSFTDWGALPEDRLQKGFYIEKRTIL